MSQENQQQPHAQVSAGHIPPYTGPPPLIPRAGDAKATASLVCGIIAFFSFSLVGVAGIILAVTARKEAGKLDSKSVTGLILSIVAIVRSIAFWVIIIVLITTMPTWFENILEFIGIRWLF